MKRNFALLALGVLMTASRGAVGQEVLMPNHLINEASPYLLQHAYNPVDWYPWGPEAFAEARRRDVPIFLSIGYSTCYWCHVMERESFEDPETAALMNANFVCIKVDREERPDVDDIYMTATQIMTGGGGWPMSVFLEPKTLEPFWCGTYFPAESRGGRPSFKEVLAGMADIWKNKRDEVRHQADKLAQAVRRNLAAGGKPVSVGEDQVLSAVRSLLTMYDRAEGGFGRAPKFPQPVYAAFLLDARDAVDEQTRDAIDAAVRHTLDRMAVGGLFDQVGGGFHRYCVDGTWTVPHFEKMLYDNALLVSLYARAATVYDDAFNRRIAGRTLDYIAREMTSPEGGFYSAQDAEADGREGSNYLWTPAQIRAVLSPPDATLAIDVYGLDQPANFSDPHHPNDPPAYVLRMEARPEVIARRQGMTLDAFYDRIDAINKALYEARMQRPQPRRDDKIIAAWNGMMITAMARAGATLGDQNVIDRAEHAARFVLDSMRSPDGLLYRTWRKGETGKDGVLEDYAWMITGLLALRDAGRNGTLLEEAQSLGELMQDRFADADGVYADVPGDREDLFVRARPTYDGATPSGISTAINALLDLAEADPDGPWLDRAITQIKSVSGDISTRPVAAVNSTRAVLRVLRMGKPASSRLDFGTPPPTPANAASSASAVEVFADRDRVIVRDDEPAELTLGLKIKPGYHILAADPVVEGADAGGLVPLRVGLVSGQGVAVYADYPRGKPYGAAIVGKDELLVHTGEIHLRVAIEKADGVGAGPGKPVLGITFQACDDASCLEPVTIRLGVEVVVE